MINTLARFLEFLDYRERMQGHIMSFDEWVQE